MRRLHCLSLVLLLGVTASIPAAEAPQRAEPWASPEVQDVVYLGDKRPVLFRMHLYVDGKPFSERWNDYLARLFKYLDRDENGWLDKNEITRMPTVQQFTATAQNLFQIGANYGHPPLAEVDGDGDKKVTFEEFASYYHRNGVSPVRLLGLPGIGTQSTTLTNLLFTLLDTNKDGKLSRAELDAAAKVLRKFDQDDDELVTAAELQNGGNQPFQGVPVQIIDPRTGMPQTPQTPFLLVAREEAGKRLSNRLKAAQELLTRYDRNKDGKLDREELGFPKELFARLNPDETGQVDAVKLLRWLLALPDVELTFRIGKTDAGALPVEVVETERQDVPALPVRKVANGAVAMTFGKTNLNLVRADNANVNQTANYTQFYLQQFRQIDTNKKGFLTAKQLENPQFVYLKQIMKLADRNEDDKLTEKELIEFNEVMSGGADLVTSLQFSDFGQGLFEMLDANRDGRLGVRELRSAWTRLAQHDDDGDGCISKEEMPRQCQLAVTRGTLPNYAYNQAFQVNQFGRNVMQPGVAQAPASGPVWFRKMDVNNDGDVSPREFLGSPEDFARIDTDGDGLISLEEAIKADVWMREKLKAKP